MKVIVDPLGNILYKSFYIYGLEHYKGIDTVSYSSAPFCELSENVRNSKSLRFITRMNGVEKRCVINCNDSYQICPELYDWCDVYGSVNANFALTDEKYHSKLVSLCPSFAIRCWSIPKTLCMCFRKQNVSNGSIRKHIGKYKRLLQRPQYESYIENIDVDNNYLFHLSTKWIGDEWNQNDETVNLTRARFIRACKSIGDMNFEGGLLLSANDRNIEPFMDCGSAGVSPQEWLYKTKQSMCVFNTPAYWRCHGWKLGEYMALGKAIISTTLFNDLPAPLVHGEHIHFVEDNQEALVDAVRYLHNHQEYRRRLEGNISKYWNQYGTPMASIKMLLDYDT